MMMIKTTLDKSGIHGIGVYAAETVKKGQVVSRFVEGFDRKYTADQIKALPEEVRDFIANYAYGSKGQIIFPADNDRFTNHAADPNTTTRPDGTVIALRDIQKGEEITCNYADFDDTWYQLFPEEKPLTLVA